LYANEVFANEAAYPWWKVNSDTIGKWYVESGSQVRTGTGRLGTSKGGVLSVSELWIGGVQQPPVTLVAPTTVAGLSAKHAANGLYYHVYDVAAGSGDVTVTVASTNGFHVTGFAFDMKPAGKVKCALPSASTGTVPRMRLAEKSCQFMPGRSRDPVELE
jgi:hypothetical protein